MATVLAPDPAGYMTDLVAWADAQAALLRAGRYGAADMANIVEEIEGLAQQRRSELRSRLSTIVQHWLKLELSPASDPRAGWRRTIGYARVELDLLIGDNPSLNREVDTTIMAAVHAGARLATVDLDSFGELNPERARAIAARKFTRDELLEGELP